MEYLKHHGIEGQQWHVKNGPPYPLSNAEKKDERLETKKEIGKGIIKRFLEKHKEKKIEKIKSSDNPRVIIKYLKMFSTQELQEKANRLNAIAQIKKQIPEKSEAWIGKILNGYVKAMETRMNGAIKSMEYKVKMEKQVKSTVDKYLNDYDKFMKDKKNKNENNDNDNDDDDNIDE